MAGKHDRITVNPETMNGQPCIRSMRIFSRPRRRLVKKSGVDLSPRRRVYRSISIMTSLRRKKGNVQGGLKNA